MKIFARAILVLAALALAACQSTPAPATPLSTPADTFYTPGAPTPTRLPTMTPFPSPTARPSATTEPPTATVPPATPTQVARAGTPTPTPVIVNGQPKMWWVDQMVKQPDGLFMAPEAVRQTIREMALGPYLEGVAFGGADPLVVAKTLVARRQEIANKYYIGKLRDAALAFQSDEVQIPVTATISAIDVRAFSSDGLTARVTISQSNAIVNIYRKSDWSLKQEGYRGQNAIEIWVIRFDPFDSRWKYEEQVALLYP